MKKVLVAVAMILGMGTTAVFAQEVKDSTSVEVQVPDVEFAKLEVADLPQEVTNASTAAHEGATIKEAFVANKPEGKVFKVIITTKDGEEVTLLLNEKGETVKE